MPLTIPNSADITEIHSLIAANGEYRKTYSTAKINFKTTGAYEIFDVPQGKLLLVDQIDIVSTDCDTPSDAPYMQFGTSLNPSEFTGVQTNSNSLYARDTIYNPWDAITPGNGFVVTITTGGSQAELSAG